MSVERTLQPAVSLLKEMGFTGGKLVSVVIRSPSLLCLKPAKYEPLCKLLEEFGIGDEARSKLVQKFTNLLAVSVPAARARLQTLVEVAAAQEDLDSIFRKAPTVWHTSEKSMHHTANYLMNKLGFDAEELRLLVLRDPLVISHTKENLAKKCSFLLGLGLSESRLKAAIPAVFHLSVEHNRVAKAQFLSESGFTKHQIAKLVAGCPNLLGLKIDHLALKLSYLVNDLKRDIFEAVRCPSYFRASLAKRIKPRFAFVERHLLDRRLALGTVLKGNDADFCRRLKTSQDDYKAFKVELSATTEMV